MRSISMPVLTLFLFSASPLQAQCFGRNLCDPSVVEIRSQISVNVPVESKGSTADTLKEMEETRKQLYSLAGRECDTLHDIFGGDCSLSSVNINSSVQDRGLGNRVAFVSISNTYIVKKVPK